MNINKDNLKLQKKYNKDKESNFNKGSLLKRNKKVMDQLVI